jgi:hypothetical protein
MGKAKKTAPGKITSGRRSIGRQAPYSLTGGLRFALTSRPALWRGGWPHRPALLKHKKECLCIRANSHVRTVGRAV